MKKLLYVFITASLLATSARQLQAERCATIFMVGKAFKEGDAPWLMTITTHHDHAEDTVETVLIAHPNDLKRINEMETKNFEEFIKLDRMYPVRIDTSKTIKRCFGDKDRINKVEFYENFHPLDYILGWGIVSIGKNRDKGRVQDLRDYSERLYFKGRDAITEPVPGEFSYVGGVKLPKVKYTAEYQAIYDAGLIKDTDPCQDRNDLGQICRN